MQFGDHAPTSTPVDDPAYIQHLFWFENGYGASVIRFAQWAEDHWELALTKGGPGIDQLFEFQIVFDNPDVEGARDLSPIEVGRLLDQIKELKS